LLDPDQMNYAQPTPPHRNRTDSTMGSFTKRIIKSRSAQATLGTLSAAYLRLVWNTSRLILEPADLYERWRPDLPFIVAFWHGQHFMMPFLKRAEHRVSVLISRHRDGEINAIAAEKLGLETIRGSGDPGQEFGRKGAVNAFRAMLSALRAGSIVATTADVPKVSRVAGRGVAKLARSSGRAIYPVAVATSRRIELANWDRSAINLPFGRVAMVVSEPIRVRSDADDAMLETCRQAVERQLNRATARAYALVDGHPNGCRGG
jgi:lysophospholipid acyltransferase (LPLAT)-like uncharacterized protein